MILKNDILKFTVLNKTVKKDFSTYSQAVAFAKTLDFAFVNIKSQNETGDSSVSASVCRVRSGQVEMIHARYAIDFASQYGAV